MAPRRYTAEFEDNGHGQLRVGGALREDAAGPWRVQAVEGTLPDDGSALIIWRNRPRDGEYESESEKALKSATGASDPVLSGNETAGIDRDNAVLDAWFEQRGYARDANGPGTPFTPDLVFVNGDCNLLSLRPSDATWEVQLIEERFLRLMFETEGLE